MPSDRWLMLALLVAVRATMGIQFQTVGSLGPILVEDLGIGYAELGTLIGLYLLPGIFIALPGGALGGRFGARPVALGGLALMVAGGALMSASGVYAALVAGRLISGTGAVLMNVAVTKMAADWFVGREIRTAMAVLVASWPLGLALGLSLFGPLATHSGREGVMAAAAFACLVALFLIAVVYRQAPESAAGEGAANTSRLNAREWRLVLIAGFIWGVYNVSYIVLISFLPSLFAGQGYTLAEAGAITSLMGWALIALVPVGGYLADRGRQGRVMVTALAVTAAATLALPVPHVTMLAYAVVLLAGGLPAGAIMALPATALRPQSRAFGMGIYFTCYYAFMASLPTLGGWARDLTENVAAPLWFAAAMLLAAIAGLAAFRSVAQRRAN